jgi:type II secretory ATPase GspE/PulE/Tfp pilus assembly ATPase PilB-like protein
MVRQDPDIIMIGEIRDKETAAIAIHAALTGHLVISTLHTNDAPSAAMRLIDMGIEPFLVTASLIGILAQRLVRILCPHCRKEYIPSEELIRELNLAEPGKYKFYKETGCPRCSQSGYSGRTGIFELLIPDDEIRELIIQKKSVSAVREKAIAGGLKTLRLAGWEKVCNGITSISELLRVTE